MKIKVIILPGGDTAKEVNKTKKPVRSEMGGLKFIHEMHKWTTIQNKLRTFRIVGQLDTKNAEDIGNGLKLTDYSMSHNKKDGEECFGILRFNDTIIIVK